MRGVIIAMISLALVAAVLLTGVLVLFLTGRMPFFGVLDGRGFDFFANLDLVNRQVYDAAAFDSIAVHYSSERLSLLAGNDGEIVLEEYMSRWEDGMLARVSTDGGRLEVNAGERKVGLLFSWRCEVKLYVPRDCLAEIRLSNSSGGVRLGDGLHLKGLTVDSTSGSVKAGQVQAEGDIRISASSGSISADGLAAGGEVALKNTSGSIRPGRVRAQSITAENTSGSIRFDSAAADAIRAKNSSGGISFGELAGLFDLSGTSGSIRVENAVGGGRASGSSGSVTVEMKEMTGDVSLSATSGSCRLTVPDESGFSFEASTTSGSIKTPDDKALTFNQKGNGASGDIGGGGPLRVTMKATSGSVRVGYR